MTDASVTDKDNARPAASVFLEGVHKSFYDKAREIEVIRGVSLEIEPGEVFGILGENGAGKTTLIRMMSTQLVPDRGTITVAGHDVVRAQRQVRGVINVVEGGDKGLYPWLTARENLRLFALLYGQSRKAVDERVETLLDRVRLKEEARGRPVMTYSKGMKQLVLLAKGLVNAPKVLFLDEPTVGLDMDAVHRIREIVRGLKAEGTTVVLTSHNASDVDSVCERVALLVGGRIERLCRMEELRAQYRSALTCVVSDQSVLARLQALAGTCRTVPLAAGFEVEATLDQPGLEGFYRLLAEHPGVIDGIAIQGASLEEFYRTLIGGKAA